MDLMIVLLFAGAVFGLCFLADKGFQKLFRGHPQHRSGRALRLSKKYGSFGVILVMLGVAGLLAGLPGNWMLMAGSALIAVVGIGLIIYYLTFGIYYDDKGFLYSVFGKRSRSYPYGQIRCQQLYAVQGGSTLLELHMADGSSVTIQLSLEGAEAFLNTAFLGWVQQNNIDIRNTQFHDPKNSCWFPSQEVE